MSHAGAVDNRYSMGIANFVSNFELSNVPMRSNIELNFYSSTVSVVACTGQGWSGHRS